MDLGEAVLTLKVDSSQLNPELDKAKDKTSQFNDVAKKLVATFLSYEALKKVIDFLKDSVTEYLAAEEAVTKLASALRTTGEYSGTALRRLTDYAGALQSTTKFSDEASMGAMTLLMTLGGLTSKMAMDTLPTVQDLASGLGIDLSQAATLVSKAIEGNAGALGRYGIKLEEGVKGSEALAQITTQVKERFDGLAYAMGDTASGKLVQLQNAFSDIKEEMGKTVVNAMKPLVSWLIEIASKTADVMKAANDLKDSLNNIAKGYGDLNDKLNVARDNWKQAAEAMKADQEALDYNYNLTAKMKKAYEDDIKIQQERINTYRSLTKSLELQIQKEQEEADAAAAKAKKIKEYLDSIADAYRKTDQGKIDSLKADIAYWEKALLTDKTNADKIKAILADLKAQYQDLLPPLVAIEATNTRVAKRMADDWEEAAAVIIPNVEATADEIRDLEEANKNMVTRTAVELNELSAEYKLTFETIASTANQVLGSLSKIWSQYYTNQNNALDTWYQKEIAALGDMTNATEEQLAAKSRLDKEYHDKQVAIKKAEWESNKAMSLANATISGIEAVVKTLAAYPWPWSLIPAGIIAALAAVQIGMIAAEPEPAFAKGGDFTVPPGYEDDSYRMRVSSGEHVSVTPPGMGGDMIHNTLVLDGSVLADWVTRASRNKKILTTARSVVP